MPMVFVSRSMLVKHPDRIRTTVKYLTMFFLWMSCVLFGVKAFTIAPIAPNAVIFIKSIFLTKSGTNMSTTGIYLEWSGGHAWFQWSVTIASITGATVLWTDANGKIINSAAGGGGLWESLWKTGTNNILMPKQIDEVKFQVGSWSVASWAHAISMGENNLVDENSAHSNIVWWQNNAIQNSDNSLIWWGSGNQIIDANINI